MTTPARALGRCRSIPGLLIPTRPPQPHPLADPLCCCLGVTFCTVLPSCMRPLSQQLHNNITAQPSQLTRHPPAVVNPYVPCLPCACAPLMATTALIVPMHPSPPQPLFWPPGYTRLLKDLPYLLAALSLTFPLTGKRRRIALYFPSHRSPWTVHLTTLLRNPRAPEELVDPPVVHLHRRSRRSSEFHHCCDPLFDESLH
jgi:hypothetical protein